jgi:hypothetical protein
VTDLERFFRRLVGNLANTDPARLHRPLPLTDLQYDIVPYRANRRALELDTSEDYEMVLLRLCAGEGGLVRTEPEEARVRFAKELRTPNPDLGVLQAFDNVLLTLRSEPLARALGPDRHGESAYAPPGSGTAESASELPRISGLDEISNGDEIAEGREISERGEIPNGDELIVPETPAVESEAPHCLYCGGRLPAHRAVNFCPHCGQSQTVPVCTHCRSELETGWKHCVNCGAAAGDA